MRCGCVPNTVTSLSLAPFLFLFKKKNVSFVLCHFFCHLIKQMACVPPLELWCSGNAKDWRDALALEEEAIASVAKRGKTLLAICVYSV